MDANSTPGTCSYCEQQGAVFSIEEVASEVARVIEKFYLLVDNGDGEETSEIIGQWVCDAAVMDIDCALGDFWFDRDSLTSVFGDDPRFKRHIFSGLDWTREWGPTPMEDKWDAMERSLKYASRYVNSTVASTLSEFFGPVSDDVTQEGLPVVINAGPGQSISELYRARVFQETSTLETALRHPERELGAPPAGKGSAGRMNAPGISVFYAATHPDVAIAEVRPPVGAMVTVAKFRIQRKLKLLDLTRFAEMGFRFDNLFDRRTEERALRVQFARKLVSLLSLPVMPDRASEEYLVTQAIADFLASSDDLDLDGLVLESTQVNGEKFANERNVILFSKAARVFDADAERGDTVDVRLWEFGDGQAHLEPVLSALTRRHNSILDASARDPRDMTLSLNFREIEVRTVVAVEFISFQHGLRFKETQGVN
ncbi:RES domain-containing protein [Pandoraea sputorum]|uniref:RES domain-containing protein n=1 Tax=Pandoraea sputorum TaxID=93222 RepID=UPI002F91AC88